MLLEESYCFLAGLQGEQLIDQFIKQAKISGQFVYLPNITITLPHNKKSQIDGLLITEKYILIVEVKNMKGELFFESSPAQLIQKTEEGEKAYSCPQIQVITAAYNIKEFCMENKILDLPVHCVIAMPNRKTIIRKSPKKVKLLFGRELPLYIEKLNSLPSLINKAHIKKLAKSIDRNQSLVEFEPLSYRYKIDVTDLKKGVICKCGHLGVRINQRIWRCNKCNEEIENALEQALEDWFLLIKSTISIKEGMEFLGISNRNMIRRLFIRFGLIRSGTTRSVVYSRK
ncbi:nuclease-related domain-containing protein [Rummeliibacillus pycnus]|uniref:nuclease-related domain-containing protein n=1 Tax=Rummeliibacillus pycnus TaxID=101070 RepID=UPI003D2BCF6D